MGVIRPLAVPRLAPSYEVQHAYARITNELLGCRLDAGVRCRASAEARAALAKAKSDVERRTAEEQATRVDALKRRCDANDAAGCMGLARESKDTSQQAAYMQRACELGNMDGCFAFLLVQSHRDGGREGVSTALEAARRGVEQSFRAKQCVGAADTPACGALAKRMAKDAFSDVVPPMTPEAERNACEAGDPSRCTELARLYRFGGPSTPADEAKAAEYQNKAMAAFKVKCDRGDPSSCVTCANELLRPRRGAPDYQSAAACAINGCNALHDPMSCYALSDMYERGLGVPADAARAKRCKEAANDLTWAARGCP